MKSGMSFTIMMIGLVLSGGMAQAGLRYPTEVKVIDPSHAHLTELLSQKELIIDHVNSLGYEVYGPEGLPEYLDCQLIPFVVTPHVKMATDYPSAEQSLQTVKDLAAKYPKLITLTEIGQSVEGRPLMFARVTAPDGVGTPLSNRPEFKYIANMHGDEIVGRELMVKLIEDLASHYGSDARITSLLNSTQVYILPSMNPDGATHQVRFNAHDVDLNRSFPDFTTSDNQNTTDGREPEIQAVMRFEAAHHFVLSANFHGGAEVVNYPWDAQSTLHPLNDLLVKISLDYAKRVPYIYSSTAFNQGITNGFAWYQVQGGMQDWSDHWHNDLQLTIELTQVKWPSFSTVADSYQANRDGLIALIEDLPKVKGL